MIKLTVNIIWSQNNIVWFKEGTRYTIKANKKENIVIVFVHLAYLSFFFRAFLI